MLWILLAGAAGRLLAFLAFTPIWNGPAGDSPGYSGTYALWAAHYFSNGERTPIYPLFLGLAQWLAGMPPTTQLTSPPTHLAAALQLSLGLLAASLLYYAMCLLRIREGIAFAAALCFSLVAGTWLFELTILTQSLSLFFLVLDAVLFTAMMERIANGSRHLLLCVAAGAAFGLSALLRSENLVFVSVLIAVTAMLGVRAKLVRTAEGRPSFFFRAAAVILLVMTPLVLAWMTWNYVSIGEFRISSLTGWNRCKTVYNLFDRVGPEDKVLGEIMVASYRERNRDGRVVRDHMWTAEGELLRRSAEMPLEDPFAKPSRVRDLLSAFSQKFLGMKYGRREMRKVEIGDYAGKVSWKLARKCPGAWLENVSRNFLDTFRYRYTEGNPATGGVTASSPSGGSIVKNERLARFVVWIIQVQAPLLAICYTLTLGYVILSPLILWKRNLRDITAMALAMATVVTFLACCALAGYNREYSVPHLGIMFQCLAYAAEKIRTLRGARTL